MLVVAGSAPHSINAISDSAGEDGAPLGTELQREVFGPQMLEH